jgi:hypothetical protein
MSRLKIALGAIAAISSLSFMSAAGASVYTLDVTTDSNTVVNLNITANNADSVLTPGFDITKVTGTVGGVAVSSYSGVWGGNGDVVSSGLYLDPYLNQNPAHIDSNGTNVFTVQNPPGSGGANVEIDNIFYASSDASHLSWQGGIALLLNNGATYYLSADCNSGGTAAGCAGGYFDWLGGTPVPAVAAIAAAVPEASTWTMMLLGFAGFGFIAYRRKSKPVLVVA